MKVRWLSTGFIALLAVTACTVNPVTGERNFQLYDSGWENQVGRQMYAPMKQSQGGEFILDPELTAYVDEVGQRLAAQARRKDDFDFEFSILNSSVPNAWALPGGKIVINRGLLVALESEAELAAVLGHEIVHADAAHTARAQSKGVLTQAGAMVSMVILGTTIDSPQAREVAMIVPAMGAQMLTQKYGRDAERESDEYGMLYMSEAGYDPQGAIELQETFVELSESRQQDWLSGLFASHPPSQERVDNNRKTAEGLPKGGEFGRERYQARLAYLERVQPAYDAFDEANKALSADESAKAQELINRAMAIEPRESLFHGLQGDIHALNKQDDKAIRSYQEAVRSNPGFFYGYLRKGQLEYRRDRKSAAHESLSTSIELMPTAEAHYLLGLMERDAGNNQKAVEHFRTASGSDSESGKRASRELVLMELELNPSKYIASRAVTDDQYRVWVQFANRTSVDVKNLVISYAWLDDQGQTRQSSVRYGKVLQGGKQDQLRLELRLNNAAEVSRRVRVEVTGAEVVQ